MAQIITNSIFIESLTESETLKTQAMRIALALRVAADSPQLIEFDGEVSFVYDKWIQNESCLFARTRSGKPAF